jgi:hypothetical protein
MKENVVLVFNDLKTFSLAEACRQDTSFVCQDKMYEFDHTTPDGYMIFFDHTNDPVLSCNGRLVSDDVLVCKMNERIDLKKVKCAWTFWTSTPKCLMAIKRSRGDSGLRIDGEGSVIRRSRETWRRDVKHEEEDEKEMEESEGEECDDGEVEVDGEGEECDDGEVEVDADVDVDGEVDDEKEVEGGDMIEE